jgi:hypothetical protein
MDTLGEQHRARMLWMIATLLLLLPRLLLLPMHTSNTCISIRSAAETSSLTRKSRHVANKDERKDCARIEARGVSVRGMDGRALQRMASQKCDNQQTKTGNPHKKVTQLTAAA